MPTTPRDHRAAGVAQALIAYSLWGVLPVYLWFVQDTGTLEIIGWRVVFSVLICAALLTALRQWRRFVELVRRPRAVIVLGVAGLFVLSNWLLYVWSVETGRPLEGALGYYLNPLVSMVLGMLVLRERLRPLQWLAVGFATAAVVVLVVGYGTAPWLALAIAVTFGVYGLVKKQVGATVDPVAGFTVETLTVLPIAAVLLAVLAGGPGLSMGSAGPGHSLLLALSGAITTAPLVLFASASRHLKLVELASFQYLAPTIHFVVGITLFGEEMPLERWLGFGLVWTALVIFSVDLVRSERRMRPRRA